MSKKILVLSYEYPPVGGGGGMAAQDISEGLVRRGCAVQVLTAHWGKLAFHEERNGVVIHRVRSLRSQPFKAGLLPMAGYILASLLPGLSLIRKWKPDLMHVHFAVPTGAAGWVLSKLSGVPYVLTAHLGDVPGGVPEKTGKWFRWIYPFTPPIWRSAARVAAVSDYTRQLALKQYPVEIQVIPNSINTKEINPGVIGVGSPPQIAFAGRFMAQKNPLLVVRTLARLKDLPWTCVMIGDGPLRAEVEQEIARLDLQKRFILPGWVTPQEVLEWFHHSDILFMPSLSEGLSVSGVQGLAMGLALVLSRVGGNGELVNAETRTSSLISSPCNGEGVGGEVNGYLVEADDADGFEQALRRLVSDPAVLLSFRQASRRMAEQFDTEHVVKSYIKIFDEVICSFCCSFCRRVR